MAAPITINVDAPNVVISGSSGQARTFTTFYNQTDKAVTLLASDGERIELEPNTVHVLPHIEGRTYRVLGPELRLSEQTP